MGAVNYNETFVVVALVYQASNLNFALFCQKIWGHAWVGLVVNAFFAYPHAMLWKELNNGIMAPTNYVNEKQSCYSAQDHAV